MFYMTYLPTEIAFTLVFTIIGYSSFYPIFTRFSIFCIKRLVLIISS